MHNCDNCEILSIVAMLSWNLATFMTAWLFKCKWIDLWSMGELRFFWMWTTNHIAELNWRSANGLIHPDYWRQFRARTEFSPRPRSKAIGEKQDSRFLFCVSCLLLAHNVLLLYSGKALCNGLETNHHFLAKILRFGQFDIKITW